MGAITLVRQTFIDARWYRDARAYWERNQDSEPVVVNPALERLDAAARGEQPVIFDVQDELGLRRAMAIEAELGFDLIMVGTGTDYREAAALAAADATLILPIDFPEAPEIETPEAALDVSLATLQHWELAPGNAAMLADAGVDFAITSEGSEDSFWGNLRAAVAAGLDADRALAALTTAPAEIAGVSDKLGTLEAGKLAHFIIADGDMFDDGSIQSVVVDGIEHRTDSWAEDQPNGVWAMTWHGAMGPAEWTIDGGPGNYTLDSSAGGFGVQVDGSSIAAYARMDQFGGGEGHVRMGAIFTGDTLVGTGSFSDGSGQEKFGQRSFLRAMITTRGRS